ncbi:MAG: glycosyltransferase family 2 protein [Paramuribaculum sp.]|nr:glycosyltransferase family 2 protein [Paramuribaculum sp.]
MQTITILIPAYNEAESLIATHSMICGIIDKIVDIDWTFLFVNDGSTDDTALILDQLRNSDPRVQILTLSRNFGKENAMLAGMDYARGDALLIMDADGQHQPDIIPQMIARWRAGIDDVYALRSSRDTDSPLRRSLSNAYYRLLQKSTDMDILPNAGDYRLLDRRCVDALRTLRESQRYTKGLYSWIGFKKEAVSYEHLPRKAGKSNFSIRKLFRLAFEGITSFTVAPLRFAMLLGIIVSMCAFAYIIFTICKTIFYGEPVQGYPTLLCCILFLGGVQLIAIGIIGEYIGRIFMESKRRPPYIVSQFTGTKPDTDEKC